MHDTLPLLQATAFPPLRRRGLTTLQVNLGYRCNLTILSEPGFEDLAEFLAEQGVEVVSSLPCYLEDNVDRQRGKGVYARSIDGLKHLNQLGYGQPNGALPLHLVYNPGGTDLPLHGKGRAGVRRHLSDLLADDFSDTPIAVADHCYGCTAGQGSSCGGALDETQAERAA